MLLLVLVSPPLNEHPLDLRFLHLHNRSVKLKRASIAELRKKKKGGKNTSAPMELTSLEYTALRLYRSGKINIEDYGAMVGCKLIEVAKSEAFSDLQEQFAKELKCKC